MVPLIAFESETAATAPVDPTSLDFGPPEEETDVFGGASVRNLKRYAEKKAAPLAKGFDSAKSKAMIVKLRSQIAGLQQSINDYKARAGDAKAKAAKKRDEMAKLEASKETLMREIDGKMEMAMRSAEKSEAEEQDLLGKLEAAENAAAAANREVERLRGLGSQGSSDGYYRLLLHFRDASDPRL